MNIHFFTEDLAFKIEEPENIKNWIYRVIKKEGKTAENINYIFCSDQYLHKINVDYLNHDTLTDIITFDQSEEGDEGFVADIFISIERVKENAATYAKDFEEELHRVMIHGVLHLIGYQDKTELEKKQMREKEEASLSLRNG